MKIEINPVQRQILQNQYLILSKLDESQSDHYISLADALQHGFEGEYYRVVNVYSDSEITTYDECEETNDILNMYRRINSTIFGLSEEEKLNINLDSLKFEGFDANNDNHYSYAKYMIGNQGRWEEYKDFYMNSHNMSSIKRYRQMLKLQNERLSDKKSTLSKEDLIYMIENLNRGDFD